MLVSVLVSMQSVSDSRPFKAAMLLSSGYDAEKPGTKTASSRSAGVTVSDFSGKRQARSVHLEWITTREIDLEGFELQRASSESQGWEAVAFIASFGNSTLEQRYLYTDHTVPPEDVRYMLRIRNRDGSAQYSRIITVPAGSILRSFLVHEPEDSFGRQYTASIVLNETAKVALSLTDSHGNQLVRVLPSRDMEKGKHNIPIDCSRLARGNYELHLHTSEGRYARTLTL
ncbi:MAG: hypothetical protein JXA28_09110, partial [Bacteroidetes bacterium]|nr:hypothetical protein [Bacteroidota bacterium]